ncbi:MAG: uroporphyrinogen decarboxylase family protein [Candidatus Acidiferrales bacterium]
MSESLTPRQMVKGLLRGIAPARPLLVPIVFSLGARLENLPLPTFLGNATKISNSLRQIRGHLRSDGVSCYFDPFLEAEALGGALQWTAEDRPPTLCWPENSQKGELPNSLRSAEEAAKSGRVTVAAEVIRRLSSLRRDDSLLMAGVTGPFTLAARILQVENNDGLYREDLTDSAVELAAAAITRISAAFVEAGANLIFIQEGALPIFSAASCEEWATLLAPALNTIRFFEALPVLLLTNGRSFAANSEVIQGRDWDCVICPALDEDFGAASGMKIALKRETLGVALPHEAFRPATGGEERYLNLRREVSELHPSIVTTTGDLPAAADLNCLKKVLDDVSQAN